MNGADILCDTLLALGVNVCFANPGTSEMHFVAALDRRPEMRCILGLFEGVVTGAADGYGRMTGTPAATLLHTGPGLANGLANLHNARRARTPIINIVGDHASYHLAFDAPLTSDIDSFAKPVSHWLHRVAGPDDVGPATRAAYVAAMSQPGIATMILPADAAWSDATDTPAKPAGDLKPPAPASQAVTDAAKAIRAGSGRVGLLLGAAALRGEALDLAGRLAADHGLRLFSDIFISRLERGAGRPTIERMPYALDVARDALRDIDVLILVGTQPPVAMFAYPGKPSRLTRDDCTLLTLARQDEDAAAAVLALADELGRTRLGMTRSSPLVRGPVLHDEGTPSGKLTEDAIAVIVARHMPDCAILCDEAITSARRFFAMTQNAPSHDYLMNTGAAIGIGIPLAIGAAVACPDRKVIGLQADGSGLYTVQGLWTQARENLDILTIVFSNRAYAILQGEMRAVGVNHIGRNAERMLKIDEPYVAWIALAKGFGVEAVKASTCEQFFDVFSAALKRRGPFLIEALI